MEHLLQEDETQVDVSCGGLRPLHLALRAVASNDSMGFKMVELLLRYGANPNPHQGDTKMQPASLHGAVLAGDVPLVSLLLDFRAVANGVDAHGSTALHTLCQQTYALGGAAARRKAVDVLLRHGANPMALDSAGRIPEELGCEPQLRAQLQRASYWYTRAAMAIACRQLDGACDTKESGNPFFAFPDLQQQLFQFVVGTPETHDFTMAIIPCWFAKA